MAPGNDPLGKRALYLTAPDARVPVDGAADRTLPGGAGPGGTGGPSASGSRAAGKHALFSGATTADRSTEEAPTTLGGTPTSRAGPITVSCSSCGTSCRVGIIEFLRLQFPFGAWLPRRRFDRWMTCPACRRRTWTSVTLLR